VTLRRIILLAVVGTALAPSTAGAFVAHTIAPGETLWSIAAANNLTTRTVAAVNGLSEDSHVVLGSTIKVPTVAEGSAALAGGGSPTAAPAGTVAPDTPAGAPHVHGAYVVRAGDTLSGIAASAGVPIAEIAAMNGLAPDAHVITGTVMRLPNGAASPANASAPLPADRVVPQADPVPTPVRLDGARVAAIAAEHGVPGALAAAIGWQESGFNNAMVSSANARGIMQVMPGTWSWIQENLAQRSLDPNSAEDNVRAGALYLGQLLRATGGDEAAATAGYYQGLRSVRERGMYDDTRRYVNNVLALKSRFGG